MKDEPKPHEGVSVDEMMDRLREQRRESEGGSQKRPRESRETITRSDGSKVVKVRRRSSRQKSTKKEEKKSLFNNTWMLLLISCLVVFGVGGALGLYLFQNARLNSPDYLRNLSAGLKAETGADFQFSKYELVADNLRAEKLSAVWPEGGLADEMSLGKLHAHVRPTSYLWGKLSGESIGAKKGSLILKQQPALRGGSFGKKIPELLNFSTFRCDDLDIFLGPPSDARTKLLGTRASLEFGGSSNSKIFLQGGSFVSPLFGATELRQALVQFFPDRTELNSLTFASGPNEGDASLSGIVLDKKQKARSLRIDTDLFELNTLIQGRLLTVVKDVHITSTNGRLDLPNSDSWKLKLNGTADGFDLTALPIMSNLGILVEDNNLSVTQFKTESQVSLEAGPDYVKLNGLNSERRGLFAIKFDCEVYDGDKLRGRISVGLSPRYTERSNFLADGAFDRNEGPYRWCDLKISGTLDAPHDDSTKKFRISRLERDEAAQRMLEREIERQKLRQRRMERARGLDGGDRSGSADGDDAGGKGGDRIEQDPGKRFEELTR